jgi:ribosomal protein S30
MKTYLLLGTFAACVLAQTPALAQQQRACQTGRVNMADNYDAPATMTLRSGSACNRNLTSKKFKLNELQFVQMPTHGKLVKRGQFGYQYVANKGYTGADSFAVRYVGEKVGREGRTQFATFQGLKWTVNVVP